MPQTTTAEKGLSLLSIAAATSVFFNKYPAFTFNITTVCQMTFLMYETTRHTRRKQLEILTKSKQTNPCAKTVGVWGSSITEGSEVVWHWLAYKNRQRCLDVQYV